MMMAMMMFVCTTQPDIMMWFLLNGRQNIVENLKQLLSRETVEGDQVVRLEINNQDHVVIVIILSSGCTPVDQLIIDHVIIVIILSSGCTPVNQLIIDHDHLITVIILPSNCFVLTHIIQNYNTLSEVKTRQVVHYF